MALRPLRIGRLKRPGVVGEAAALALDLQHARRVVDGRFDLAAMADDAGIGQQTFNVVPIEARHALRIEAGKRRAEVLALAQDGQPAQARLEAFEAELLEQAHVIADRPPPLVVVVVRVVGQVLLPGAAQHAVLAAQQARRQIAHEGSTP